MSPTSLPKLMKRAINGILLLDKPIGLSSNQALQKTKRLYQAKKAGHTGSLDPLASGMLPICFGEATKFSQYLLESDKRYRVVAKLGVRTATGDAEGEIIATKAVSNFTEKEILKALSKFNGDIQQIPSMFSALKFKGRPLYELARQGIEVERKSRTVHIYEMHLLSHQFDEISLELKCSKGTYVRTLVDDLGELLGCGAHVTFLRRLTVGIYPEEKMISLETLNEMSESDLQQLLLPIETTVMHWPELQLLASSIFYLKQGQAVLVPNAPRSGWVRIATKEGRFVGVGEIIESGMLAPRRMVM